jgi:uncharacterized protein YqgC (DUF456 family)
VWDLLSGSVGIGLAWAVTLCLLVAGVVGCVLPMLPGHLFLFLAAVAHRLMLGKEGSGLEWWSFVVLGGLMVLSQAFEFLSGAAGARWFGGSRWGALGAFVGSVVGLFFFPLGLLVGPLAGAVVAEIWFGKSEAKPAMVSGVGSVVGTLAGMGMKLVVGFAMILWFFVDVFWVGG